MNENPVKKCRTCLKNSTKTFPLTNHATGFHPKTTYSQLLQKYAKLEYPAHYEHLMPQNLCALCCLELRNAYTFIRQAQYCNNKLINLIGKQLPSLEEKAIVSPQNEYESNIYPGIKLDKNSDKTSDCSLRSNMTNDFRIVSTNALLNSVELDESIEQDGAMECDVDESLQKDDNKHSQNEANILNLGCSIRYNNKNTNAPNVISDGVVSKHQSDTICPICEKIIQPHNNIITHLRIHHDIGAPSKYLRNKELLKVNYEIDKDENVAKEVNQKPKNKVMKCVSCNYTARTYSALNFHNRSKHGSENKFECNFCPYITLKKFNLFMHVKNSHKQLIRTLRMDPQNQLDERETFFTTREKSYFLDKNENSTNNFNIKFTSKITSNNTINEDKEELGDDIFIRNILNMENRQHEMMSTNWLPRRCDECGNIYNNLRALKIHQKKVHISEENYMICPQCGKRFKGGSSLRVHIKTVHISENSTEIVRKPERKVKEKRFMCTECFYVCGTISLLTVHVRRQHTGERPYKCDICYKSFAVRFDLKIHRYLHTGERPYKCSICSKCFRCSRQLVKHKRIHNKERPYKCKECGKTFTQSYNLTLHKRIHLKEKKLNCTICDKLFENQTLLNMHRINENHHDEVD